MIAHLVIGGGLAGASVAALLAQRGHTVTLLEKQPQDTHKVCGEFISIEAQHYLQALGVDLDRLGAVPIRRVRLIHERQVSEAALPFIGKSLTRHTLDAAVRQIAVSQGATLRMGCEVLHLSSSEGGFTAALAGHETLQAQSLYLANGKHELRGWQRKTLIKSSVGFKMLWRLSPAAQATLRETVELYLFKGGYAGLEPVEKGLANLCLAVTSERLTDLGKSWSRLLAAWMAASPALAETLRGATPLWEKPLAVAGIPYGFVHHPTAEDPPQLYRLGDQMAVIPSFCGDGMAMALHSAFLAIHAPHSADYYDQARADFLPLLHRAGWLSRALHSKMGRKGILAASKHFPALLTRMAHQTRVPASALLA